MGTQYFVTAVVDCEECGGAKWVQHPGWRELRAENHASGGVAGWTEDQLEAWFLDHGYRQVPDEDWRCPECDGVGSFERRVDLAQALEEWRGGAEPSTNGGTNTRMPEGVETADASTYDFLTNEERLDGLEVMLAGLRARVDRDDDVRTGQQVAFSARISALEKAATPAIASREWMDTAERVLDALGKRIDTLERADIAILEATDVGVVKLNERIAALEARVAALEEWREVAGPSTNGDTNLRRMPEGVETYDCRTNGERIDALEEELRELTEGVDEGLAQIGGHVDLLYERFGASDVNDARRLLALVAEAEYWRESVYIAADILRKGYDPEGRPPMTKDGKLRWYRMTGEDKNRWSNAAADAENYLRAVIRVSEARSKAGVHDA